MVCTITLWVSSKDISIIIHITITNLYLTIWRQLELYSCLWHVGATIMPLRPSLNKHSFLFRASTQSSPSWIRTHRSRESAYLNLAHTLPPSHHGWINPDVFVWKEEDKSFFNRPTSNLEAWIIEKVVFQFAKDFFSFFATMKSLWL